MQASILYHSATGTTKQCAEFIAEGMARTPNLESRLMAIDAVDKDYLSSSSCVILGSPTYLATFSAATKTWLDKAVQYKLAGKLGGAFATADYIHGGADIAIQAILAHFMVLGMLAFSGGGSYGKPVIHFGPVAIKAQLDDFRETFTLYGQRLGRKTADLFA